MNLQLLIERANQLPPEPYRGLQHPRPTQHSIAKINQHFGVILPHSLLEFVRYWRSSGRILASLGSDFDSFNHIIRINSYWRNRRITRRIPSNLIVINQGHDDDCICLDLASFDQVSGEYAIRYWSPGTTDRFIYSSFPEYMSSWLDHWHSSEERDSRQSKP